MTATAGPSVSEPKQKQGKTTYFSRIGCVIAYPDRRDVFVGGALIGSFASGDFAGRNIQLVACLDGMRVHKEKLAKAFGITSKTLRKVLARYEEGGLAAIVEPRKGGKKPKLTAKLKAQLAKLFEAGLTIDQAHVRLRRRVSRTLVGRAHKEWADVRKARQAEAEQQALEATRQQGLDRLWSPPKERRAAKATEATEATEARDVCPTVSTGPTPKIEPTPHECTLDALPRGESQPVQHVGGWIAVALVAALGFHRVAEALRSHVHRNQAEVDKSFMTAASLRVALDAALLSLAIGQRTVEGVRRLATPSASVLLRARGAASPTAVRRTLGGFAKHAAGSFELLMTTMFIRSSEQRASAPERVVFYVDGHMRPYTGKHTIRKGWRMQDKRARPGVTDYWVHDEDGRAVLRENSPAHASMTKQLRPIGDKLRAALVGENVKVLMVFDRAGAFPRQMAELRDEEFEFATYERRPYPAARHTSFPHELTLGKKKIRFAENARKNLRKGRGRVRRIMLKMPAGERINILAVSTAPPEDLIRAMLTRWARQENQFKHGVERWGINQLDGRQVDPYPPDAVIPNPARPRIHRALRAARVREGEALRKLDAMTAEDPKRDRQQRELSEARALQDELKVQRAAAPKHAPVRDTDLAGKLVQHRDAYKAILDLARIALAHVEDDLAGRLAPHLSRPREARKALANLLQAPGTVRVGKREIIVTLLPAATSPERAAFDHLLVDLNTLSLRLPGDPGERRLRFQLEKQ